MSALFAAERAAKGAAEDPERWLESLRLAARDAMTVPSLDEVLRHALESIAAVMDADAASVLLADPGETMLISRASIGLNKDIDLDVRVPRGQGFAGRILGDRAPLAVEDMRATTVVSPTLRESGLRSLVGVPLVSGAVVVGVMHVGSREIGKFSEADAEVLEVIAEPISAAIRRVRQFEAERNARQEAERSVERLRGLQRITAALASAGNLAVIYGVLLDETRVGFPESDGGASIWMMRRGRLELVAGTERSHRYKEIPLDSSYPPFSHLESGEPLFVSTRDELVSRWPVLGDEGVSAFAGIPLHAGERTLGLMAIAYVEDHEFDENEKLYLTAIAEQASLALDRALTREREMADQDAKAFVAEASLALSTAYGSPEQLLQQLTDLVVPRLADWASVLLLRGNELHRVALAARPALADPDVLERAWSLRLDSTGPAPASRVLRTGRSLILDGAAKPGEETHLAPVAEEIGLTSAMLVPLTLHGRTIGVMSFVACGVHEPYEENDLALALEIAQRTAVAAEDAMERHRDRELAEMLTRALLPARFPGYEAVSFAARYVPADAGPVGGDWYDVFELPDRRLAIVIGDVSGHGVEAASTMARLRMGLVAYATEKHEPVPMFERLTGLLTEPAATGASREVLATVLYGVLEPETRRLSVACAGHMPWVHLRAGNSELVECGGRALVPGLPAAPSEKTVQLSAGDTLVFVTDGVIERHDESVEDGLERLRKAAGESAALDLESLCDEVLSQTAPRDGRRDDCCVLAMRLG